APGDDLTHRTLPVFFDVVRLMLQRGVTVIAEAAFQDRLWTPNLEPMSTIATLRIVQCHTDPATAWKRIAHRQTSRTAHADDALLASFESGGAYFDQFHRVAIAASSIDVDTTDGYDPELTHVVEFVNRP
ncbi:MAG: ATP-binding protein, partial [Acidimicrobiales bacterium]